MKTLDRQTNPSARAVEINGKGPRPINESNSPDEKLPATDGSATPTATAMARVEAVVGEHFPEALDAIKVELAVVAAGCLKGSPPTTLIFTGESGSGKSLACMLLFPDEGDAELGSLIYRSDEFTTAAFLSQAGDRSKKELRDIDLLRRIAGKTLVTKELAAIFRGKESDLVPRFNRLTAILDGKGFTSDSGTHGRRSIVGDISFQWIGATTPLSTTAIKVFGALGPRMVFYWVDRLPKSDADLVAVALDGEDSEAVKLRACHEAVRDVVLSLPDVGTVGSEALSLSTEDGQLLVAWGKLTAALRAQLPDEHTGRGLVQEHPERVIRVLRRIAIGSALAHGRYELAPYDLAQVAHIALSSGFGDRSEVARVLLDQGGEVSTPQLEAILDVSPPTARARMEDLARCEVATLTKGAPDRIRIVPTFAILCAAPRLGRL